MSRNGRIGLFLPIPSKVKVAMPTSPSGSEILAHCLKLGQYFPSKDQFCLYGLLGALTNFPFKVAMEPSVLEQGNGCR